MMKFALAARNEGITLGVEMPQWVPLVTGDIALIERVIDNLIDNALRYAGSGGRVSVRLQAQPQTVRVEVHDTGPGIPEGDRARVFDRFYRGDRSRLSQSGHAGLGLAIARGILELHGSSIDFTSGPGEGTTFFFELPMDRPGGAGQESQETP
jgi:signal transduction histidine kinase